ncbi:sulfatase-like hydrolase/transferase [Aliirhizobium smilacinae]|uniref:Sulfatase N-terminal domain-containing protein n=1 Tax=Aliirhizobium smilacinae TaxID=1395944 RepID=A0A5C4X9E0_9HYPH|nr:sulfatase-like hydrolase/transferase [Rhizobium smilacinae]TNM59899.1 hypothetical protein FHP24_27405 [Rhizobium smilacinae]
MLRIILASAGLGALLIFADRQNLTLVSFIWNYLAIFSIVAVGVFLFNRFWFSVAFAVVEYLSLLIADRAKLYFMDDHLRWSDVMNVTRHFNTLTGFRQFIELIGPYVTGLMDWKILLGGAALIAVISACFRLEGPYFSPRAGIARPWRRFSAATVALIVAFVAASITAQPILRTAYAEKLSASSYRFAGMPMFLFATRGAPRNIGSFSEEERHYAIEVSAKASAVLPDHGNSVSLPDIVVWFNESTFDPRDLTYSALAHGKLGDNAESQFPMFQASPVTIQYGTLNVGIFGGKSWNTVFALQAGAHVSWFSDDTYAASTLAGKLNDTFFKRLKVAGYVIESLYAQDGYLFDAARSELDYGADRFYGTEFLNPSDQEIRRATDADVAEGLRRLMANPSTSPRAFFVFTSANHGPYPSRTFYPDAGSVSKWGNLPNGVLDYLKRVSETDRVVSNLTHDLLARERPTILLHLGDHKPQIPGVQFAESTKYQTYYQLLANFDPPPSIRPGRQDSDIMYAASKILYLAGIEAGPLFAANMFLAGECQLPELKCSESAKKYHGGYRVLASQNLRE